LRFTNETPLARFLLRTRSGHCEYFATATVLLLRQLGIPARYAVGYAVHEASGRQIRRPPARCPRLVPGVE
jgi:transglutaminase-like putative cysteine protease